VDRRRFLLTSLAGAVARRDATAGGREDVRIDLSMIQLETGR